MRFNGIGQIFSLQHTVFEGSTYAASDRQVGGQCREKSFTTGLRLLEDSAYSRNDLEQLLHRDSSLANDQAEARD